uniref:2c protein n=1 Tax=Tobacco rattle virus TaxID=12295 RepID=A0A1D8QM78_9VIRU|nr:2c protein [Tobacco rattle virus]AOW42052.1 2c protein [Tobacco rattle virus]
MSDVSDLDYISTDFDHFRVYAPRNSWDVKFCLMTNGFPHMGTVSLNMRWYNNSNLGFACRSVPYAEGLRLHVFIVYYWFNNKHHIWGFSLLHRVNALLDLSRSELASAVFTNFERGVVIRENGNLLNLMVRTVRVSEVNHRDRGRFFVLVLPDGRQYCLDMRTLTTRIFHGRQILPVTWVINL